MLNPREPLYKLAQEIDWNGIEAELSPLYSEIGRPAKPIRLLVELHLLKHRYDLGDETVVKARFRLSRNYLAGVVGDSLNVMPVEVHRRRRTWSSG